MHAKRTLTSVLAICIFCLTAFAGLPKFCLSTPSIENAKWLIGTWEMQTSRGNIYETWTLTSAFELTGKSYSVEGKDTITFENVRILQKGEDLHYIPTVKDQNDGKEVVFTSIFLSPNKMIFSAPEHDFPQSITYTRISNNQLVAEISGSVEGNLRYQTFPMKKISTDHSKSPASDIIETHTLKDLLENYYSTMSDRDWEAYRSFFWNNATITTIWQVPGEDSRKVHVSTIDEFIAQTPQGPDSQPIFEEKMVDSEFEVRGNLAIAWARYEAKFGTEAQLMEWEGTDLFTFMKYNDEWKIVSLAFKPE